MHNNKGLLSLDFDDISNAVRKNDTLSIEQAEIITTVYGIIYPHIPTKKSEVSIKRFIGKYYSDKKSDIFSGIEKDIENKKLGKIMERVIIEYLLHYKLGTTSYIKQDLYQGIDFIFKSGNIKIGTDITMGKSNSMIQKKRDKVIKQSCLIDSKEDEQEKLSGIGRKVDCVSLSQFRIPYQTQILIFRGITLWQKNNFALHWKNYLNKNEIEEIEEYFKTITNYIQGFFYRLFTKKSFQNMNFYDGVYQMHANYNEQENTIELIISEKKDILYQLSIPFTQKLIEKLGIEKNIKREKIENYEIQEDNNSDTHPNLPLIKDEIQKVDSFDEENNYKDRKKRSDKIKRRKSEENDKINLLIEEQDFPLYLVKNQIVKILKQ